MAFPALTARMPEDVGDLEVRLVRLVNGEGVVRQARYTLQIVDAAGDVIPRLSNNPQVGTAGDLIPHLTVDERTWLVTFVDRLYGLARQQLLGKED